MYYKVFLKNNNFEIIEYFPQKMTYSNYIRFYVENGYKQFIFTTSKMVKFLQYIHENSGLIKKIELRDDFYNYDEIETVTKIKEKANENMINGSIFDLHKAFFHNDNDSIDIQRISVLVNKCYFDIMANGIISSNHELDIIYINNLLNKSNIL